MPDHTLSERQHNTKLGQVGSLDGAQNIVSELDRRLFGDPAASRFSITMPGEADDAALDLNIKAVEPHAFSRHSRSSACPSQSVSNVNSASRLVKHFQYLTGRSQPAGVSRSKGKVSGTSGKVGLAA